MEESDRAFLDAAFEQAQQAIDNLEVPVGCVFVYGDQIVARGRNDVNRTKNPTNHAEMCALKRLKAWCRDHNKDLNEVLRQTTLYVTLEPCIMCACAMYHLQLKRIVYGAANERFGGIRSVANANCYGSEHPMRIDPDVDKDRAVDMLKLFYQTQNPFCPIEKRKGRKQKDGETSGETAALFSCFDV